MQKDIISSKSTKFDLHCYDEVESTNKIVKLAIANGKTAGFVAVAKRQNGGRGMREHRWESPEGGLYMSIILDTNLKGNELTQLPLIAAEIVVLALNKFSCEELAIKKPNDIIVKKSLKNKSGLIEKLCGISTEYYLGKICCGIGINILRGQQKINIEEYVPAYLQDYCKRELCIEEVRDEILRCFLINSNNGLSI